MARDCCTAEVRGRITGQASRNNSQQIRLLTNMGTKTNSTMGRTVSMAQPFRNGGRPQPQDNGSPTNQPTKGAPMENELMALTMRNSHQLALLTEAVLQLIEQTLGAEPAHASRFADAMRARTNALLAEADPPDQAEDHCLTELLSALLAAAGKPPQRG